MSSVGFYEQNAEAFVARTLNADMSRERAEFLAHLAPGSRILDAGCGSGRDARAFAERGFQVVATEASPKVAERARMHTGLSIEVLTFDQFEWREAFEGIWACASLLHVPRADLPDILGRLQNALVPGGTLWMSFKYGSEERELPGRRFTDLDEDGALSLLAGVDGLNLIEMTGNADARPDHIGERWLTLLCKKSA